MKAFVIIAFAAAIAASSALPKPAFVFPGLNTGKIVGGVEATPYEFPFIVDMRVSGRHYCGGSIISPEWVVTAAHCSQGSSYTLTAGDHNIDIIENTEQVRTVVKIIIHPAYGSGLQYENDIALMQVSPPFEFNDYVAAVKIPDSGFPPTNVATVTGWGALSSGGSSPSQLYKVDVPYVNDDTCNIAYDGGIAPSMICYGEAGKDSCQGDSGGPILSGRDTLVGIVSWGRGCALPGYPGVYTETSYFGEWIKSATIPTAEDETPAVIVNTCGGLIESSSAGVKLDSVAANQKCAWSVKVPYDAVRFRLVSSGLGSGDGLYLTEFSTDSGSPGTQTQIVNVGEDYRVSGNGLLLLTLSAGASAPAGGFNLEFYSSGFGQSGKPLSGFSHLSQASATASYPANGGQYRNGESALLVVNPPTSAATSLAFTSIDVEGDGTNCQYDVVRVYSWNNNRYNVLNSFCGTSPPSPFSLPNGLGLVTFTTDESVTGSGFTFQY